MAGRGRGAALTVPAWMKDSATATRSAAPAGGVPPSDWARATAAGGRPYWYSRSTGQTTWTDPSATATVVKKPTAQTAAAAWAKVVGKDGRPYYYNKGTRETRWDPPPDFAEDAEGAGGGKIGVGTVEQQRAVAAGGNAAPDVLKLGAEGKGLVGGELPKGWVEYKTPEGKPYFHCAALGKTVWKRPMNVDGSAGSVNVAQATPAVAPARPAVGRAPAHGTAGVTGELKSSVGMKRVAPVETELPAMVVPVKRRKTRTRAPPRGYVARPKDKDGKRFLGDRESESYFLGRARKERERLAEVDRRARIASGKEERGEVGAVAKRAAERARKSKAASEYVHVKRKQVEIEWSARERFEAVMKDSGVTSSSSWLETMARCTPDERYEADIKTYGHRKQAYSNYVAKLARAKREEELVKKLEGENDFMALLQQCFEDEPMTVLRVNECSREKAERFESDQRYSAVGAEARADMIREYFRSRERIARGERLKQRRMLAERLRSQLDAATEPALRKKRPPPRIFAAEKNQLTDDTNELISVDDKKSDDEKSKGKRWLTDRSSLTEAESRVRHSAEFQELSTKERADVFHAWLDDVRSEAAEAARSARKDVVHGIKTMAVEGRVSPRASWREVEEDIMSEPFAMRAIERNYILPQAFPLLFRDGIDLFYKLVDAKSVAYRDAVRAAAAEGLKLTDENITSAELRKWPSLAPVLKDVPTGVADALLHERRKKELRRKEAAIAEFEGLLRRRDVDGRSDWGILKQSILERTVYKQLREAVGSDDAVETIFFAFVERREQRRKRALDPPQPPRPYGDGEKSRHAGAGKNMRPKYSPNAPVPRVPVKRDEDTGWAAALSSKDSDGPEDEAKKKEERERRKRAILAASASGESIGKK